MAEKKIYGSVNWSMLKMEMREDKNKASFILKKEKKKKHPQGMGALGFLEKGTQVIYDHKLVLLAGLSAL